jgi:hypothetical protein
MVGCQLKVILQLTVSRPVCPGIRPPSGVRYQFSFSPLEIIFKSFFFKMRRPLWGEDGSVIYWYKCYWVLPAPSLSGPSHAELDAISYCLIWDSIPFLSPLISRRSTVEAFYPASTREYREQKYWHPLHSPNTHRAENVSSNVACSLVAGETTCP